MNIYLESDKKRIIGKTISLVGRTGDAAFTIEFIDGSSLAISIEGDCCSHSWIYDIVLPSWHVGAKIIDVKQQESEPDSEEVALEKLRAAFGETYTEEQKVWNIDIVTDLGNIVLKHINISNGYYDGMTTFHFTKAP